MLNLKKVEQGLFFLTLLFLPTQLGRHFWPQFSFVYSLPIDYLSPTLYFWDILVLCLWVVFLISGKHISRLALIFFYFFILTQAISLVFNTDASGVGLIRLEQYTIAGLFGVYIASSKFKIQNSKFSLPLSMALLGESVLAIMQFLKGGSLGFWILGERAFSLSTPAIAKFDFYGREFLRPYGTFPHPNVLAAFMLISLMLLPIRRWSLVLGGLTILLTVSRVALIAGFALVMFIFKKNRKLVILFVLFLLPVLYTRYASIFNFDNLTFLRREQLSLTAFTLWTKHPLFGVGLNNFIPSAADFLLSGPNRFLQPVHNIFLLSLSETGLIGLVGLISLIGYPIFKLVKFQISNFKFQILTIWATIIFLGMFDHYFLTLPQGYRLLFLVWGLSMAVLE